MTLKQAKMDVTDQVVGKIKNGEIQLFLEKDYIGKVDLPEEMSFQLEHHFEADSQKIYRNVTVAEQPDAKYTDCDDGGWC